MDKEILKDYSSSSKLNEKIFFDDEIAKQTASLILKTESYIVNFNRSKEDWIKLPDGKLIPCYCNCRYINRDFLSTKIIGDNLSMMIKNKYPDAELIVGLETAGISWGSRVALDMGLPFAYARGKAKGYGTGKLIECNPGKNLKTVIIDDAFFSGESVDKAIKAVRDELNGDILGLGFIVNLSNLKNNDIYEEISKNGIKFYSLTGYSYILSELQKEKKINLKQKLELAQFYDDPEIFSWNFN